MRPALSEPSELPQEGVPHLRHVPAAVVDQRPHHEGPEEATQRVHGHGERPEQRLEVLVHEDPMPVRVGLVVEVLHVLERNAEQG